jgi:hypothetical protein
VFPGNLTVGELKLEKQLNAIKSQGTELDDTAKLQDFSYGDDLTAQSTSGCFKAKMDDKSTFEFSLTCSVQVDAIQVLRLSFLHLESQQETPFRFYENNECLGPTAKFVRRKQYTVQCGDPFHVVVVNLFKRARVEIGFLWSVGHVIREFDNGFTKQNSQVTFHGFVLDWSKPVGYYGVFENCELHVIPSRDDCLPVDVFMWSKNIFTFSGQGHPFVFSLPDGRTIGWRFPKEITLEMVCETLKDSCEPLKGGLIGDHSIGFRIGSVTLPWTTENPDPRDGSRPTTLLDVESLYVQSRNSSIHVFYTLKDP